MEGRPFKNHRPLYLVFQQDRDTYFTDSLLALNFHDWLWLSLRKSGYEAVYILDLAADGSSLTLTNPDGDGSGARRGFRRQNQKETMPVNLDFSRGWNLLSGCNRGPAGTGGCAFVFYIQAFSEVFRRQGEREREDLLRRCHLRGSRDSLILVGSRRMSAAEQALYTGPDSVFAAAARPDRQTCLCLCDPAARLLEEESGVPFFDALKRDLGDGFLEPGLLTWDYLRTLLRRVFYARTGDWTDELLDEYTAVLFHWLWNPGFHPEGAEKFGPPGEEASNPALRCLLTGGELYEYLLRGGLDAAGRWLRQFAGTGGNGPARPAEECLAEKFGRADRDLPGRESHVLCLDRLPLFRKLEWPSWAWGSKAPFPIRETGRGEWNAMRRALLRPSVARTSAEAADVMNRAADLLPVLKEEKDFLTARRAVNVLMLCGRRMDRGEADCRWTTWWDYLVTSRAWFAKCSALKYYRDAAMQKIALSEIDGLEELLRSMDLKLLGLSSQTADFAENIERLRRDALSVGDALDIVRAGAAGDRG